MEITVKPVLREHSAKRTLSDLKQLAYATNRFNIMQIKLYLKTKCYCIPHYFCIIDGIKSNFLLYNSKNVHFKYIALIFI